METDKYLDRLYGEYHRDEAEFNNCCKMIVNIAFRHLKEDYLESNGSIGSIIEYDLYKDVGNIAKFEDPELERWKALAKFAVSINMTHALFTMKLDDNDSLSRTVKWTLENNPKLFDDYYEALWKDIMLSGDHGWYESICEKYIDDKYPDHKRR